MRPMQLAACLLSLGLANAAAAAPSTVSTDGGQVSGVALGAAVSGYVGIPYARPPVGNLRWQEPQPPTPWSGVRAATHYGPDCPQSAALGPYKILQVGPQSEDCLYLNVFVPTKPLKSPAPVLFWIYGGAYLTGGADLYNGAFLAQTGVVVVTFNYRLGALGYLASSQLVHDDGVARYGNYGSLDQLAALKWVQRNIDKFGGDPSNVTLIGQSAGGDSVARLMVAPAAHGLFAKAIMHSPFMVNDDGDFAAPEKLAESLAGRVGCGRAADMIGCLRQVPAEQLVKESNLGLFKSLLTFGPVTDGKFTPRTPRLAFANGEQAQVPVIIGNTSDEAEVFTKMKMILTSFQYHNAVRKWFGANADTILAYFPASGMAQGQAQAAHVATAAAFVTPSTQALQAVVAQGQAAYEFHFEHLAPYPASYNDGVFHGVDMFYLFGWIYQYQGFTTDDVAISNSMVSYWTNFAATGNPNLKPDLTQAALPFWPKFDTTNESYLRFDTPISVGSHVCNVTDSACSLFAADPIGDLL